jgi:hypothetical protein
MSQKARNRRHATARAAAERAAAAGRIRRRRTWAGASIVTALLVVVGMVVVRAAAGAPEPTAPAEPAVDLGAAVAAVSPTTLDAVGRGTVTGLPTPITGQPDLRRGNLPLVVYIGAEYCPFCAAQRWPVVIALSRFGRFTALRPSHSATDDVFPGTATVSFHGATYTSTYLAFEGVETASNVRRGNTYEPMDALTAQQQSLLDTYDRAPYVPASSAGAIPFLDFANRYVAVGSSFDPTVLAGLSTTDIVAELKRPDSRVAQSVLGSANALTALLCGLTGGQPGPVCSSPGVKVYSGQYDGR